MIIRNTENAYGIVTQTFHWLIAFLVIGMIIFGFYLESIPKAYAGMAYNMHKLIGMTILLLMVLRLLWALVNIKPSLPDTSRWERFLERAVHYGLYALIIAMPLTGWIGSSASGRYPRINSFNLIFPVPQNKTLARLCFELHDKIAIAIITLVCIHFLAALYHEFIRKDDIFKRMIP